MPPYIHVWWKNKNTNSQTNSSTKHVLNAYGGVMQNEIYYN